MRDRTTEFPGRSFALRFTRVCRSSVQSHMLYSSPRLEEFISIDFFLPSNMTWKFALRYCQRESLIAVVYCVSHLNQQLCFYHHLRVRLL